MANVKLLDSNTINKIAAGEVVERPASVVKELVENSIDAGAKRIEVEIQNGGKALIRVTDDGAGMSREDAVLSIRRHATSKISTVADLTQISTLGFRGEALPTIAAVSKFTLQTRRAEDELGTKLTIDGGKIIDTHEVGCKVGTTILVEDLFFNTPARLKFLKTTPTEANKINDFVGKLAISHPEIVFRFINGNRTTIATPGNDNLFDTINAIYGAEVADSLLSLEGAGDNFKLRGYVTKPNMVRSYRSWQTFTVNGRVVESRLIAKAIDEAYKSLVPKTGFPFAALKIDVPQNSIDVNVHPQKIEIKFEDENKIFKAVYHAMLEAVEVKATEHNLAEVAAAPETPHFKQINLVEEVQEEKPAQKSERKKIPDDDLDFEKSLTATDNAEKISKPPVEKPKPVEKVSKPVEKPEPVEKVQPDRNFELEPIGQVARCYLVAQSGNDLYLVDQHAAHERILFDRLSGATGGIPAQQLLMPLTLTFDEREAQIIENNLDLFRQLGFTLRRGDEGQYSLMEIPVDVADADAENMLREILSSLPTVDETFGDEERQRMIIAKNIREACLATTACRAAIKAGQELNFRQMQVILTELSKTQYPFTCPHGRPTIIKFDSQKLATMFKRTGF